MEKEGHLSKNLKAPERVALAAALAITANTLISKDASAEGSKPSTFSAEQYSLRVEQIKREFAAYQKDNNQIRAIAAPVPSTETGPKVEYNHGVRNPSINQAVREIVGVTADIISSAWDALWSHWFVLPVILIAVGRSRRWILARGRQLWDIIV